MTIGEKIRSFRIERKLTQKELSALSGINEVTIRKYESGKIEPKSLNLKKLANAFKISPAIFLGIEEQNKNLIEMTESEKNDFAEYLLLRGFTNFRENSTSTIIASADGGSIFEIPVLGIKDAIKRKELLISYSELNSLGQDEAIKRISELTEIEKYKK